MNGPLLTAIGIAFNVWQGTGLGWLSLQKGLKISAVMNCLKSSSLVLGVLLAGCVGAESKPVGKRPAAKKSGALAFKSSLLDARKGFETKLVASREPRDKVPVAPARVFSTVKYPSAVGNLAAYVTPDPRDGKKHPAIVWITGGDCNSIGDVWSPRSAGNDQSAAAFRKAGIVMMFPSLRGGNDNPGAKEGFLGEVDDVLAAAKWLEKQPYVDPKRIYLGGHSTGGTLALLVTEASPRFRATFAFGPVDDVRGYGADSGFLPYDLSDKTESLVRSPGYWVDSVRTPTWIIEGGEQGNIESLRAIEAVAERLPSRSNLHFIEIQGATHFSDLAPTNGLLAKKVVADTGAKCNISLSEEEANRNFGGGTAG